MKIVSSAKTYLLNLVKNSIFILIVWKIMMWFWNSAQEIYSILEYIWQWIAIQHWIVFFLGLALFATTFILLSVFPITRLWIFKLKRDAKKRSYFSIMYPIEKGGYAYGFVHSSHVFNEIKFYEAVIFWGGYSRLGWLLEGHFLRINLSIPEVILHAYIAPWLPFLSKYLSKVEIVSESGEILDNISCLYDLPAKN